MLNKKNKSASERRRTHLRRLLMSTSLLTSAALAASVQATSMSDVAAALQGRQWAELTTSNFNSATLADGTAFSVFWFSEDLAWDPLRRKLHFVGGGHGSDAEFVSYDEVTNTWSRRKPAGGIPWNVNFSHAYDHLALVPTLGRLYFRQPASDQSERIEIFDLAAGTWSRSPLMPSRPECCGALEYFPELGGLVQAAGSGPVFLYDPAASSWSTLSSGLAIGDFHNFAEYSARHRMMILGGGEGANGRALFTLSAARQFRRIADAPQRMGTTYSVVTSDPVGGNFLVFFDTAAYEMNPVSETWTPIPAPPWLGLGTAGIFNVVATPIPVYGVTLFAKYAGDDSRVYLYKHTSANAPLPAVTLDAAPGTVAAGGFSSLTWTTTDATACVGTGGTAAWPGPKSVSNGSENVGPLAATTMFSLSCAGPGGAAQRGATITVTGGGGPAAPTLTLSATPTSVTSGGSTQLSWSTTNAMACTASGGWSGGRGTSGNETIGGLTATTTFTLQCSGGGGAVTQNASVTVSTGGGGGGSTNSGGGGSLGWWLAAALLWARTLRQKTGGNVVVG